MYRFWCDSHRTKKKKEFAIVYASDICGKALEVAKHNAFKNNCEINFVQSDLFQSFYDSVIDDKIKDRLCDPDIKRELRFDLIISNPPYISETDYALLQKEIYFEPKIALVASQNGLFFYEEIIKGAKFFLKDRGFLFLEIGDKQADAITHIAEKNKYQNIDIYKDQNDKNRIVRLIK